MDTVEDIVGQAIRLALAGGVGLPVVLVIIAVAAVALVLARTVKIPPYVEPPPPPAAEPWSTDADHPGGPGGGG